MKTNKLTHLLVLGLAATLVITGCTKRPSGVTPIPGTAGTPQDNGMNSLTNNGNPFDNGLNGTNNLIPTADNSGNFNEDRQALAMDTVHFAYDSAVVKKGEDIHVEAAVAALRLDAAAKVRVEGHCDERGTEEYNRALGERRALAVREAMAKLGIDPSRILTISYGEDRPAAPGHEESAWKQNRRGEFVLLHPK